MAKLLLCGCIALVAVCLFPVTVWAQAHVCDSQTTWAIDPPPVGQDPPHKSCCVHQFRAGEEIGWAASYVHEGTPSLANPLILNDWILRLYEAAHAIQGANALCSERNLAWPGWYNMQDHLYRLAQQGIENCAPLRETPEMTCETFCMGAWVQLSGMLAAYGNVLGRMEADKPEQTIDEGFSACDPNYFKLGFRLGYAHYRLQAGDRDAADTQVREAIRHVQMLEDCRPWSGYCVNLWHPQLIKPNLYLLLDRNRLSTPNAVRKISDVMNEVDRTLIGGNRNLEISRCPGIDQILKVCGNRFWNGLSRASQRLASRPTVAVPPPPPPTAPASAPPSSPTAPTQPSPPSPPRIYNLSGTWQPSGGGADVSVMTGGPTRYTVSGTGADPKVRNQGTLVGDGSKFEGPFKDVPGYCCGRDGYVWLEVIDENTYRARSVWWTPGKGSKEKPQLNFGWSTWKRRSR